MKIWIKYLIMVIVIVFSFASTARADVALKEYKKAKNENKENNNLTTYVTGVGKGFFWANITIRSETGKYLYCQPKNIALGADDYSRILEDEIKRFEKEIGFQKAQEYPIEGLLLHGLKKTFPCSQKSKR